MIQANLVNFLAAQTLIRPLGLVPADQNLAFFRMIGGADQAFVLHALDERGGLAPLTLHHVLL